MDSTPEDFLDRHGETRRFNPKGETPPELAHPPPRVGKEEVEPLEILDFVKVHDAGDIDVAKIPPRGWLLGTTFCRKFISGLIAEGGAGKTAIRYVQYLAAASGRPITGEHVHVRSRVLIVCLEDD